MRYGVFKPCSLIVIASSLCAAAPHAALGEWRKISDTPGFPGLRRELQRIVAHHGHDRIGKFCIVLRDTGDHDPIAYAIWQRQHLLYRWQATRDAAIGDATLLHHTPLDLRRDIVRSPSDRLSTYKFTLSWVRDVEAQCRDHGEQISVSRNGR